MNAEIVFLKDLNECLPNNSNNTAKKAKLSFKALGGSSIEALRITMSLESKMNHSFPELLAILLDQNRSLEDALNYINGITSLNILQSSKLESTGNFW